MKHQSLFTKRVFRNMLGHIVRKKADVVAKEALQKIRKDDIAPILTYLAKASNEAALKDSVHDRRFETRDRLLYFISLCQNKQIQKAQAELNWINNQGDKEIDEFVLLPIYSERIKSPGK